MTDRALFQTFQQSKLSPNDRVYLNSARARMTTKLLTVGALSFGTVYFLKAFKDRKKLYKPRRWPWALLGSIIVTVPTMTLQAREEYRRAIIDLDDHSYLRKYLFDSGTFPCSFFFFFLQFVFVFFPSLS
jgi:hypothetical protein